MADSAVSFVVGRLAEFAVKEAGVLKEVGSDVVLLKDKLQWLHTFVQQADQRRRQGGNAYMDVWVQQTREVALEVEDVIDKFLLRVDLQQGLPIWTKCLKLLSTCATQISVRHQLSTKISMIKARLDQISSHRHEYFNDYASSSSATRPSPSISTTDGWDEELRVVGFDKDRQLLEDQLLRGDKSRLIVSILGESGIGKSTLARRVYDSPAAKWRFKARAWLDLPAFITEADIVHLICRGLRLGGGAASTMEEIHDSLSEHLKTRSYLIVVDGIVQAFNWSSVLDALPNNDLGSRVVIINDSLNDNGAALAGLNIYWLRVHHLQQEESNLMFVQNACGMENQQHHSKLYSAGIGSKELSESKEIMDNMFEITNGLPLAILLLGRLLRRKEFPNQWKVVLELLKSMERTSRLEAILALSFDDLPYHLKSCFLHFAMMPENLIHNARRLVRLWAAEGFLKPKKGESMEDIGHAYLKELVSRGMVRLVEKAAEGDICWRVTVHQRLHAMARFETQEATFLDVYDKANVPSAAAIRHLFLQNLRGAYIHHMDASFPNLRSFICDFAHEGGSKLNDEEPHHREGGGLKIDDQYNHKNRHWLSLLRRSNGGIKSDQYNHNNNCLRLPWRSKLLRVIDLQGLQVKKVPPEIGNFIHLRYLAIRSRLLEELPTTIANLINLQTLDIKGCKVKKLTQAFWTIPTLRHVLADKLLLPRSVGELKDMQGLVAVTCVHPWRNNMSPLHNMVNLRHLQIFDLTPDHCSVLPKALVKLESLVYLNLGGHDIPFTLFTGFILRRLQSLKLFGRIDMTGDTADKRCTLPNLTRLELVDSMVNQGFINKIGKLPCLTELVLSKESYDDEGLVFSGGEFASLTKLVLRGLPRVSEWNLRSESLPRVEKVTVSGCTKMRLKIEGEHEALKNVREFMVIDMPDNWPWVEESTGLDERLKRVIIRRNYGQRLPRGGAANMVTARR
ncbi:hypothetical protein HU200_043356 [Digitaria exilis]|uniref:Uncharacterized protein n=1 Tax=Digitaria exilis TaxID=1010633 RepID=A0A835BBC9_9POAL|nr:hypothetical protein HU200_043356 [Digitaria exilis]CAB3471471.1 unnamed protein product [Digitaria exilis]